MNKQSKRVRKPSKAARLQSTLEMIAKSLEKLALEVSKLNKPVPYAPIQPQIPIDYQEIFKKYAEMSDRCIDGGPHAYPLVWWGITPPSCSKCGKVSFQPVVTTTGTTINPMGVVTSDTVIPTVTVQGPFSVSGSDVIYENIPITTGIKYSD